MIWLILLVVLLVIAATYSEAITEWGRKQEFGNYLRILSETVLTDIKRIIKEYFQPITWIKGKVENYLHPPRCRECVYCEPKTDMHGKIYTETNLDKCRNPRVNINYCENARRYNTYCGKRAKYFKRK